MCLQSKMMLCGEMGKDFYLPFVENINRRSRFDGNHRTSLKRLILSSGGPYLGESCGGALLGRVEWEGEK